MKSLFVLVGLAAIITAVAFALAVRARPRVAMGGRAVGTTWAMPAGAPAPAVAPTTGGVVVADPPARVVEPATPAPAPQAVAPAMPAPAPRTQAVAPGNVAPAQAGGADMFAAWGPPPAPRLDRRRFSEAHWQGLELIPNTPGVAKGLGLPPNIRGVIVDDVSLPADLQGFKAGDVVTRVGELPTPNLTAFVLATAQLRDLPSVSVEIFRADGTRRLQLTGLLGRMGTANGETPTMILSGAKPPHAYRGPCTNCHRVGTTGSLAIDQGDPTTKTAPAIRAGSVAPHRDRGTCSACHRIIR